MTIKLDSSAKRHVYIGYYLILMQITLENNLHYLEHCGTSWFIVCVVDFAWLVWLIDLYTVLQVNVLLCIGDISIKPVQLNILDTNTFKIVHYNFMCLRL